MAFPLALIPAAISAVMGVAQAVGGGVARRKAKRMTTEQPTFNIPKIYGENVGLLEQEAQTGFSAQTLNALRQTQQQGTAASTAAILQGGGNVSDISKLYGQEREAMAKLGVENDQLKMQKVQNAINARKDLAGMQMQQWKMNVLDRWAAKQQAAALLAQQGNQAVNSGIGNAMSGLSSMASAFGDLQIGEGWGSGKEDGTETGTEGATNAIKGIKGIGNALKFGGRKK